MILFYSMDATDRNDPLQLNELNVARVDAKLEQRVRSKLSGIRAAPEADTQGSSAQPSPFGGRCASLPAGMFPI